MDTSFNTPGQGTFGSAAIGYDAHTGKDVPFPDHALYREPDARAWTDEPRRYGFHGTLKAPFELHEGTDESRLLAFARDFAARGGIVTIPKLAVSTLGRFIALTPAVPPPGLDRLAGDCVREFDPFRAPMSPDDRRRRLDAPLSERQVRNLEQWGYPYVMEDFRFHMTLTGALAEAPRAGLLDALEGLYAKIAAPVAVDAISISKQEARDSRFFVLARLPLGR